jgi:hypothetical protein
MTRSSGTPMLPNSTCGVIVLKSTEFRADSFHLSMHAQESGQRRPDDFVAGVAGVVGDAFVGFFRTTVIKRIAKLFPDLGHSSRKVDHFFEQRRTPCSRVSKLLSKASDLSTTVAIAQHC